MSDIKELLDMVARGEITPEEAETRLKLKPFTDLGFAKPDLHRGIRQGIPEVIYGEGKTPGQITKITEALLEAGQETVMVTRLSEEKQKQITIPLTYYPEARIGVAGSLPANPGIGNILIATAGTSDLPVAEEAYVTAEILGNNVTKLYDVGVAGIHRLLSNAD
ncbi:MAG: 1-(5-phosphoribosyl)-5-amino-4-imidazole-carboxylate carboxylase, partial [Saccharofermentans sp.]|nr:1-(5-phosphoribosyl)-5-amino-4-imidazole-carboxylate carboxylase [Saccharofermentans sp.]